MTQYGFLEISTTKNNAPYRLLLPFGTQWPDALEVLKDMENQIIIIMKQIEDQQKNVEKKEESAPSATN